MNQEVFTYPLPYQAFRILGADRKDFLQRQVSNDLRLLTSGVILPAALTSPVAHILDIFYLWEDTPESITAISLTGNGEATAQYLRSRVFFMDKVIVEESSVPGAFDSLWGERSIEVAHHLGISDLPDPGKFVISSSFPSIYIAGQPRPLGMGYLLCYPAPEIDRIAEAFDEAGAIHLDASQYEIIRVENGIPGIRHELTGGYTPFEVNLDVAVSGEKGCYTGQEVLARQVTYDKIVRRMAGIRLESPAEPGDKIYNGAAPVGEITSAVLSPQYGAIALGVIRRPAYQAGTKVLVKREEETIQGVVVELPFH